MFPYILLSKLNVFLILFFCSCTITPIVCWLWEINGFWIRRLRKGLGCPPLTGFVHSSSDIPEKSLFAQFLHLWFWSLFAQFCISDLSHPRSWGGSLQLYNRLSRGVILCQSLRPTQKPARFCTILKKLLWFSLSVKVCDQARQKTTKLFILWCTQVRYNECSRISDHHGLLRVSKDFFISQNLNILCQSLRPTQKPARFCTILKKLLWFSPVSKFATRRGRTCLSVKTLTFISVWTLH